MRGFELILDVVQLTTKMSHLSMQVSTCVRVCVCYIYFKITLLGLTELGLRMLLNLDPYLYSNLTLYEP